MWHVDLKSAFDSVERSALWKALHDTGTPSFLVDLAEKLHESPAMQAVYQLNSSQD